MENSVITKPNNVKLLELAISHWENDIRDEGDPPTLDSCPLCQFYHPNRVPNFDEEKDRPCEGCPLAGKDGEYAYCNFHQFSYYEDILRHIEDLRWEHEQRTAITGADVTDSVISQYYLDLNQERIEAADAMIALMREILDWQKTLQRLDVFGEAADIGG